VKELALKKQVSSTGKKVVSGRFRKKIKKCQFQNFCVPRYPNWP
jgi:hypothetical protein